MLMGTGVSRRPGHSLVELLVALALSAIVLGAATSTLLRQHRTAATLDGRARSGAQLRAATGAIGAELALLSVAAGDLVPGELGDTALELRAFVGSGVACDDGVGVVLLAPEPASPASPTPLVSAKAGDSLWWYVGAKEGGWRGTSIAAADSVFLACLAVGGAMAPVARLAIGGTDSLRRGTPLRVTRKARYAFYRSGDGSWQLGFREWNEGTRRLAAPQPIAGPFLMRVGSERTGFRYFDREGAELSSAGGGIDADRVARVRMTVMTLDRAVPGLDSLRRDSVDVALDRVGLP